MKMLIATTVAEYREKLQQFFSEQDIAFYNEFEVRGIDKNHTKSHRVNNWFSGGNVPLEHIAFFTLVDDDQAKNIMNNLNICKTDMPNCNIKAYVLNVEQTV